MESGGGTEIRKIIFYLTMFVDSSLVVERNNVRIYLDNKIL